MDELDDAVELRAEPAAKRPRVGRPARAVLAAIEADCGSMPGWQRHTRSLLLHAGGRAEDLATALHRQADELLSIVRGHGDEALDLIFEA